MRGKQCSHKSQSKSAGSRGFAPQRQPTYCGVSKSYLNKGRHFGYGPPYSRLPGGIVVYSIADLDAWLEFGKRRSTSEDAA